VTGEASSVAYPPETLEGWYTLHDTYGLRVAPGTREKVLEQLPATVAKLNAAAGSGWSCLVSLVGGPADFLVMHARERPEDLESARAEIGEASVRWLYRTWSLLGVTEAGLYHLTAELARDATARGGSVGDEPYTKALGERAKAEQESEHVQRRLYPALPADMPYVSFYPMSKRRNVEQNWYTLSLDERSQLMRAHGITGRKYAGRVLQIITGGIGLARWEWGVTLFARNLLDVKKLVTDMRFDEVSAKYAEFGEFYVGKVVAP
jgi:peroxiredoxin